MVQSIWHGLQDLKITPRGACWTLLSLLLAAIVSLSSSQLLNPWGSETENVCFLRLWTFAGKSTVLPGAEEGIWDEKMLKAVQGQVPPHQWVRSKALVAHLSSDLAASTFYLTSLWLTILENLGIKSIMASDPARCWTRWEVRDEKGLRGSDKNPWQYFQQSNENYMFIW